MLYRYPLKEEKNRYETIGSSGRYDNYTGEQLPPIPYIGAGSTPKQSNTTAGAKSSSVKTDGAKTAAKSSGTASGYTAKASSAEDEYAKKLALLEKQYANTKSRLLADYNAGKKAAQSANSDSLRDLYIAYMQGIKNLPQTAALWGAGGEVESLRMHHRTNYEDNRAKQNREYSSLLAQLQNSYDSDVLELEEKYLRQLMSL